MYELVALAPYIRVMRQVLEIVSWQSSWEESWLALGGWWALCLLSEPMLKYVPARRGDGAHVNIPNV